MTDLAVTILSLNYAPEPTGNAPYSSKLAEGLNARGYCVKVFAGFPYYPEWSIRPGFRGMTVHHLINGIDVTHLRHRVPSKPTSLPRLHMELSYGVRALIARWNKPDVVLAVSPALFATGLAVLKARITRRPVGVWVQDLYARGIEETKGATSISARITKWAERTILNSATGVAVIHERFRAYVVEELGIPEDRVTVIRNWSHIEIPPEFDRKSARERLGWGPDEVIALHAGNMGVKQNLENVVAAAWESEARGAEVRFILLGHGNQRHALARQAIGAKKLTFIDPLPDDEFSEALRSADVLLVNELPGIKEMSVPSKLTSYFATGVPVVAATEADSATADEIRTSGAGLHVPPGRPDLLLDAIERLIADPDLTVRCSSAGMPYVEEVLNKDVAIESYTLWLTSLIENRRQFTRLVDLLQRKNSKRA